MESLRVLIPEVKHALECIEANDEVQIGLGRIFEIERLKNVDVERVRGNADRDPRLFSKCELEHCNAIFQLTIVGCLVGIGFAGERQDLIQRESVGGQSDQFNMGSSWRVER